MDRAAGVRALRAAAQDRGVAGLQAQRAGIGGHVGPALVDDADHTERHTHALDVESVGPRPLAQHACRSGRAAPAISSMLAAMASTRCVVERAGDRAARRAAPARAPRPGPARWPRGWPPRRAAGAPRPRAQRSSGRCPPAPAPRLPARRRARCPSMSAPMSRGVRRRSARRLCRPARLRPGASAPDRHDGSFRRGRGTRARSAISEELRFP